MNTIDHIYYINLGYRTDRRAQFEDWIQTSGFPMEKVERVDAIHTPGQGVIGCAISHVKALEIFLNSPHSNCIVFEDDYSPVDPSTYWSNFQTLQDSKLPYDIVLCSYNVLESTDGPVPYLRKVKQSYTTSGYLITKEFAPKLKENLEEGVKHALEEQSRTGHKTHQYCLDVHWSVLMKETPHWYCFYPRIGKQRDSYSDIQGHVTSYNA